MLSDLPEQTPNSAAADLVPCAGCGGTLRVPASFPAFTCPLCGAFLTIERGPNGVTTALASEDKKREGGILSGAAPKSPDARLAIREAEEALREMQARRHRQTTAMHHWAAFFFSLLFAVGLAILGIGNWSIPGFPNWPSTRTFAGLLAVLIVGSFIVLFWFQYSEVVEGEKRKEQRARLKERIRQEKWAMYEEEVGNKKGNEKSEDRP